MLGARLRIHGHVMNRYGLIVYTAVDPHAALNVLRFAIESLPLGEVVCGFRQTGAAEASFPVRYRNKCGGNFVGKYGKPDRRTAERRRASSDRPDFVAGICGLVQG
jgi:hypothetical protein